MNQIPKYQKCPQRLSSSACFCIKFSSSHVESSAGRFFHLMRYSGFELFLFFHDDPPVSVVLVRFSPTAAFPLSIFSLSASGTDSYSFPSFSFYFPSLSFPFLAF